MKHYPPEKVAFHMRTPAWCRERAEQVGPACTEVVEVLFEVNALYRLRSAQGVLRLADSFGAERLEAACRRAINAGDPSYRTIKEILAAGLERDPVPDSPGDGDGDGGAAAFLRGPAQLFADVIPLPTTNAATETDTSSATAPVEIPTNATGAAS